MFDDGHSASMAAEAQGSASPAEKAPGPPKEAWESTNTVFTNDKAGMLGYDKDRVKKVIYEMSKVGLLKSSCISHK